MSHNPIEVYVRSSPLGPVGIHWRNISEDGQPVAEPIVLKERIITKDNGKKATINFLINDVKPSIILARYRCKVGNAKILLEVTGLEATKERSYQLGRRITEVVLWVGHDSLETEAQLRKLAACALLSFWKQDSSFLKTIREAIRFEGLNEFRVDRVAIEQLTARPNVHLEILSQIEAAQGDSSVWSSPELITSDEHLYSLAHQISQTSLPETEHPVVIVAEIKNEHLDYRGNIWKAPIQSEEMPTAVIEQVGSQPEKKTLPTQPKPSPLLTNRILILGITSAIAALIIILILMSFQLKKTVELTPVLAPPPKTTPIEMVTPTPQVAPVKSTPKP